MDEIQVTWKLPKPEAEMTEDDWDLLAEKVLDDLESAVEKLNAD